MLKYIIETIDDKLMPESRKISGMNEMLAGQLKEITTNSLEETLKELYKTGNLQDLMSIFTTSVSSTYPTNSASDQLKSDMTGQFKARMGLMDDQAAELASYILPITLNTIREKLIISKYTNDAGGLMELLGFDEDSELIEAIKSNLSEESIDRYGLSGIVNG